MYNKITYLNKLIPVATLGFFVGLMILGWAIFCDYGIHCDEDNNRTFGQRVYDYAIDIVHTGKVYPYFLKVNYNKIHDKYHGPIFEIFLVACQRNLGLQDSRDIIFMRHFFNFLFFYLGVVVFYFLCLNHFKNQVLGLMGCLFLVITPRIFADAFYNTVDLAFLVLFLSGTFTLILALDKKTFFSVFVHALICALLINVRMLGLILVFFTVVFFLVEMWNVLLKQGKMPLLRILAWYFLWLILLVILFNPMLWSNPIGNFWDMVSVEKNVQFNLMPIYLGEKLPVYQHPWHYSWVWFAITTPLLYLVLFIFGFFAPFKRNTVLFMLCFFLPMILFPRKMYNGWRHIYFIYPFFLLIALTGLQFLWEAIRKKWQGNARVFMSALLILVVLSQFCECTTFMVKNHPYQNLYFNRLAGATPDEIAGRFELDYWGLSYRNALEYILSIDKNRVIPVCIIDQRPDVREILPRDERQRIVYADVDKAKYFLTIDVFERPPWPYQEFASIKVEGIRIITIYRRLTGLSGQSYFNR